MLFAGERSPAGLRLLVHGQLLGLVLNKVVQRHIEEGEAVERGLRLWGGLGCFRRSRNTRLLLRCSYVETILMLRILLTEVGGGLLLLVVSTEYVILGHRLQGPALLVTGVLRSLEFVVLPEREKLDLVLERDHTAGKSVQLVARDKLRQLYNRYVSG